MKANRKIDLRAIDLKTFCLLGAGVVVNLLTSRAIAHEIYDPAKVLQAFYESKPQLCRKQAEEALKANPKNAALWHSVLAQCTVYSDPHFALLQIQSAITADPKNVKYLARDAFTLLQAREMKAAAAMADRVLALSPTNSLALATLGALAYTRAKVGEAQSYFAKAVLNDDPDTEFDVLLLASAFYVHTDDVEAHHWTEVLSKRFPNSSQVVYARAIMERDYDSPELALKDLARSYELDPTNVTALSLRGNLLMRMARYREALAEYRKLIVKQPTADVYGRMADCMREAGVNDEAIEYYDKAIEMANGPTVKGKVFSTNPSISKKNYKANWLRQTQLFDKMGLTDKAIANATEILRVDTKCPTALQVRQGIYLRQKRYADAIKDLTVLISLDPDVAAWHTARGKAYMGLNESSKAEADFAQAKHIENFGK